MSELPNGWAETALSEVAEVRLGRQRSPDKARGDNPRPYMRAANVTWSGVDVSDVKTMNFDPGEFETYRLKRGDVLLSEASGSPDEVGKPALWRNEIADCCFQNTLVRVRSYGPLPEFLFDHFLHDAKSGLFAEAGKGVGINHLGAARMAAWRIALPPLAEQRRIVARIESLTARSRRAKEALDAIPPLLERFRQSVLAAAFRGELTREWRERNGQPARPQTAPPTLDTRSAPASWSWVKLKDLGENPDNPVQTGPFGAQLHSTEFVATGVPVIAVGNLTGTGFSTDGIYYVTSDKAQQLSRYDVQAGDVLFARSGATLGKVCVAPEFVRDWRMTGHILRLRLDRSRAEPFFVVYALAGATVVKQQVQAGVRGMTRPGYNTSLLENIWIPFPSLAEQRLIVGHLRDAFCRTEKMGRRVQTIAEQADVLERSILASAFRGELVPQDPADEPAAALLERIRAERASVDDAPRTSRTRIKPAAAASPTASRKPPRRASQ